MTREKDGVMEIDLLQVLEAFIKRAWLIILCMVIGGAGAFSYAFYCVAPTYQSSVLFYVNNNNISALDTANLSITSQDITASKDLVDTYIVILKTRNTLEEVLERSGLDLSYAEISSMVSAGAVNETEVFRVVITDTDPLRAELIANTIAEVLPDKIASIVEGSSARVVDYAVIPTAKSAPSLSKYTLYGLIIGAVIAAVIILLIIFSDSLIHNEDYLIDNYEDIPLLGVIPDFFMRSGYRKYKKHRKGYGYGRQYYNSRYYYETSDGSKETPDGDGSKAENGSAAEGSKSKGAGSRGAKSEKGIMGRSLDFASREAYKQLRTNLDFALADTEGCRAVGVTSAMRGDGKSITAINLSYSLAEDGSRVILIEGDLRIPTLNRKLDLRKTGGLTGILTGSGDLETYRARLAADTGESGCFDVLAAGRIPPNPQEMLGSRHMQELMVQLRTSYDYIIMDLPPITAVADPLVASRYLDGMLMVVRHDHTERGALAEAARQLGFSGARILGFTFNCATDDDASYSGRYRYRGRYKKYRNYKNYGYYGYYGSGPEGSGSGDGK